MIHANEPRDPELEAALTRHLNGGAGDAARGSAAGRSPAASGTPVAHPASLGTRARSQDPPIYAYQRVSSTMDVARRLAQQGADEGTLVWAARQEQGRGRLGRVWESPEGGAYFSLILKPTRARAEIPQLSLVTGLAAAQAIHELTGLFPAIRWPNDLLLNDRKVAGILVEASDGTVIIGVGINVATRPEDLPDGATSLAAEGAITCTPEPLTGALCRKFAAWYDEWTARGFGPIREALRPWIGVFGHPVQLTAGTDRFQGTASDLDESGRLLVRLDSGIIRPFEMGEVTLLR